jgi:para-nitrobenzyl esterase
VFTQAPRASVSVRQIIWETFVKYTLAALLGLSSAFAFAGAACGQTTPPTPAAPAAAPATAPAAAPVPRPLAITAVPAKGGAKLVVTSPAFKDGAPIPFANSQYGENIFPGLAWSGAPKGTKSFAIVMQDSDPPAQYAQILTILHWVEFNIPATITKLDAGISAAAPGAVFGANMRGTPGPYAGPRTPPGAPHHYRLQVFALDTVLPLAEGAKFPELLDAMKDHVLASGELVGTFVGPAPTPPATPPATPAP